eukprot:10456658-Prorocentrum_lima.AAC.1
MAGCSGHSLDLDRWPLGTRLEPRSSPTASSFSSRAIRGQFWWPRTSPTRSEQSVEWRGSGGCG